MFIKYTAKKVSMMRKTIAPPLPNNTPILRCLSGKERQASAITTALSPDRTILMPMIFSSAAQDSGVNKASNMFSNGILGAKP